MLLGVDDTDSLEGGCTTHVAVQLVLRLGEELGLVLLEHPRLVRLNPINPWKTRGNAALVLRLGEPAGEPLAVGSWDGSPIEAYPGGKDVPPSEEVLEVAWGEVRSNTWPEDGRTNPGLVLAKRSPPREWYRSALDRLLEVDTMEEFLEQEGLLHREEGTGRGIIGAASAMAWPGEPHSWEVLAYRNREQWGTRREVDAASVRGMDRRCATTFDSLDPGTGGLTMVPSSPCPVLWGIRGTDPEDLVLAKDMVGGEAPCGWMVFRTNQATDDHLVPSTVAEVAPYTSVALDGRVLTGPRTIAGGHVILGFADGDAHIEPGDRLVVCGSVRPDPRTVNLEKFKVLSLASPTLHIKVANPKCPECGKGMKSVGADAGYRCVKCGTQADEADAHFEERPRDIAPGWYEVPPGAWRPLARPLSLGVRPALEEWAEGLRTH